VALTTPKSVLIVDDNAHIRQALCELFEREADFEVCGEAENGKQAIEKGQELRPDLIVLDLSMPVMNDFHAAHVLKRLHRFVAVDDEHVFRAHWKGNRRLLGHRTPASLLEAGVSESITFEKRA